MNKNSYNYMYNCTCFFSTYRAFGKSLCTYATVRRFGCQNLQCSVIAHACVMN